MASALATATAWLDGAGRNQPASMRALVRAQRAGLLVEMGSYSRAREALDELQSEVDSALTDPALGYQERGTLQLAGVQGAMHSATLAEDEGELSAAAAALDQSMQVLTHDLSPQSLGVTEADAPVQNDMAQLHLMVWKQLADAHLARSVVAEKLHDGEKAAESLVSASIFCMTPFARTDSALAASSLHRLLQWARQDEGRDKMLLRQPIAAEPSEFASEEERSDYAAEQSMRAEVQLRSDFFASVDEALSLRSLAFGTTHRSLLAPLLARACGLRTRLEFEEARRSLMTAAQIADRDYGTHSGLLASVKLHLAHLELHVGNPAKAHDMLESAEETHRAVFGERYNDISHPYRAYLAYERALICHSGGRIAESKLAITDATSGFDQFLPDGHPLRETVHLVRVKIENPEMSRTVE